MIIWVIEQLNDKDKWETTVGVGLTQREAKRELNDQWKFNYPLGKFRIKKYVRKD